MNDWIFTCTPMRGFWREAVGKRGRSAVADKDADAAQASAVAMSGGGIRSVGIGDSTVGVSERRWPADVHRLARVSGVDCCRTPLASLSD
ncbi:hypothetical protein ACMZ49_20100, partial [Alcaligenes phenolicus]